MMPSTTLKHISQAKLCCGICVAATCFVIYSIPDLKGASEAISFLHRPATPSSGAEPSGSEDAMKATSSVQQDLDAIHPNGDCRAALTHAERVLEELAKPLDKNELLEIDDFIKHLPPGQIDTRQCYTLYKAGKMLPGPFLEVGAFVGRSACCIARGIRDSKVTKVFFSVDLHISSKQEYFQFFGNPNGPNLTVAHMEKWWAKGINSRPSQDGTHGYSWYVSQGGTQQFFEKHLAALGLENIVTVVKGDFHRVTPKLAFSVVYADHLHDRAEIQSNLPDTLGFLSRGGVLISDDVIFGKRQAFRGENKHWMLKLSKSLQHRDIGKYFVQVLPAHGSNCAP